MKGYAFVAMAAFLMGACAVEQVERGPHGGHPEEQAGALERNHEAVEGLRQVPSTQEGECQEEAEIRSAQEQTGACVSFQAVTCTVTSASHKADCLANYGTWRDDGNCFDRDRAPILGCKFSEGTEWFFSHYATATDAEVSAAVQACDNLGGSPVS